MRWAEKYGEDALNAARLAATMLNGPSRPYRNPGDLHQVAQRKSPSILGLKWVILAP